ncbi:MAG: beta-lactamase family protein, partial [Acetobacteraceae bacterium]|nr:beta-lactamase family protein [Acetobacteraceae bacterium]
TSGLREQWDLLRLAGWRDPDLKTTADILELVSRQTAVNFPPGQRFQYINTAYTLIAVAIERITGETLRACAERLIFRPLGMTRTFFLDDASEIIPGRAQAYGVRRSGRMGINVPNFETVGPTNLHTTVRDIASWERNLVNPIVGDDELFLTATTPGRFREGAATDYGFGLIIGHHGAHAAVEHAGGDAAFRAYYLRIPRERFAVAILANVMEVGPGRIARHIIDICLPQPNGRPAETHTPPLDAKLPDLQRVSGWYRHADSGLTCRVEPRGGRLFLDSNGASYELLATGGIGFRFLDLDVQVSFDLPNSGPASLMSVRSGGNTTNVCARMDLDAEQEAAPLEEYQGRYACSDLDVTYTVTAAQDMLKMRGPRGMLIRLRRISGDGFAAMDTTLDVQFQRDDGRISGYLLSSERAWNIGFRRT